MKSLFEAINVHSLKEFTDKDLTCMKAVIAKAAVNVNTHYGNSVSLSINCIPKKDNFYSCNCDFMEMYSLTGCLGIVIKAIFDILDVKTYGIMPLNYLKNTEIRLIIQKNSGLCIGFGNADDDSKFVLINDLLKGAKEFLAQSFKNV